MAKPTAVEWIELAPKWGEKKGSPGQSLTATIKCSSAHLKNNAWLAKTKTKYILAGRQRHIDLQILYLWIPAACIFHSFIFFSDCVVEAFSQLAVFFVGLFVQFLRHTHTHIHTQCCRWEQVFRFRLFVYLSDAGRIFLASRYLCPTVAVITNARFLLKTIWPCVRLCDWASMQYLSISVSSGMPTHMCPPSGIKFPVTTEPTGVSEVGKCVSGQRHLRSSKGLLFTKSACWARTIRRLSMPLTYFQLYFISFPLQHVVARQYGRLIGRYSQQFIGGSWPWLLPVGPQQ